MNMRDKTQRIKHLIQGVLLMQKDYETMQQCVHPNCIYRSTINSGRIEVCTYTLQTGKSRNCKISECDKFKDGLKQKPMITKEGYIRWVVETYEE